MEQKIEIEKCSNGEKEIRITTYRLLVASLSFIILYCFFFFDSACYWMKPFKLVLAGHVIQDSLAGILAGCLGEGRGNPAESGDGGQEESGREQERPEILEDVEKFGGDVEDGEDDEREGGCE